ncbi:MAG: metal ABC transporter permease [Chloroflexi bacterium]|nr:metal ABC transporter permease [Chloroflexota bacterium]
MSEAFVEPFQFEFMQRALLAGSLAGLVCAVVGSYVVLKGMGFLGDAIAHSSLAGMAIAFRLGGSVLWGAFIWVVPASLVITYLSRRTRLHMDSSIGIVYALGFSVGIIVISQESGYTADLFSFLFGNVLGASWSEIAGIGAVAAIVVGVVVLLYNELLFTAYDETMAAASGVPVRLVQYLLPLLIGVTTIAAVQTVGVVLVLSLLITPAATARLLARRLSGIMVMAVIIALASVVGGLYVSFHLDWPAGPTIVLFSTGLFVLVVMAAPQQGLLWRRRHTPIADAATRAA